MTCSLIRAKLLAALLAAALLLPAPARAQDDLKLTGFLAGLPAGSVLLPPGQSLAAQIGLPVERSRGSLPFAVEFTPQTQVRLLDPYVENGQFVQVAIVFQAGRAVVREVKEVAIAEISGSLTGLPAGGIFFPLAADVPATIRVGGVASLPVAFTITPRTDSAPPSLRNGDTVRVDLTVVGGRIVAVEIQ